MSRRGRLRDAWDRLPRSLGVAIGDPALHTPPNGSGPGSETGPSPVAVDTLAESDLVAVGIGGARLAIGGAKRIDPSDNTDG